jgi:hypothetical protein
VVGAGPAGRGGTAFLMERADAAGAPYEYAVLYNSKSPFTQRELSQTAAKGFRLLPHTLAAKAIVMEKAPGETRTYEYRLLKAGRLPDLHAKVNAAAADGFRVVGIVYRGDHTVVMEKVIEAK